MKARRRGPLRSEGDERRWCSGCTVHRVVALLAATKPEVLRALARIHAEELARHYKQAAKKSGEGGKLHTAAVTFVQRFGSILNLHVHLHTCALDDVYVEGEKGEAPRFVPAIVPSRAELYVLTERVALRIMTWLRKGVQAKDEDHASNDTPDRTFAEVLAQLAMQRGTSRTSRTTPVRAKGRPSPRPLSSTKPSRATDSTCIQTSPSRPTTISAERDSAGTASVRHFRSRASASCGTDASPIG